MDEQRKLRNLLSYAKTDSVEEIEEVGKLYEELLTYINKSKKEEELLGLYKELSIVRFYLFGETDADLGQELMNKDDDLNKKIKQALTELEELKKRDTPMKLTQAWLGRLVHEAHADGKEVFITTTLENTYRGKIGEIGIDYFKVYSNNYNYKLKYNEVKSLEVMK